jgi:glycine/D-amino acid oxidase-like deaminating enzyme
MIIQLPDEDKKGESMRTEPGSLSYDPYWWDAAPRESPTDVALRKKCDVAIIGAGYSGLSAALTLARAGRSVVVLDALAPGEGASSRSGGMIGHGHRLSYIKLIERFGPQKARDLLREGMTSLEFAKALIADEKIDAQLQVSGRMRGAWTTGDFATMTRDAQALQRDLGMAVDVLSKADVHREIAADCYQGGLMFQAHGGVHPALFHRGLLQCARTAGALVAGHAPVTAVRREANQFIVETARGNIGAPEVIATTNRSTFRRVSFSSGTV